MSSTTNNQKSSILNKVTGSEYLSRGTFLQPPVMWWQDNKTQLNANNLNKLSMGIKNIQDEFTIESLNIKELFTDVIANNAGWRSNNSPTGEIFNDYENNKVEGEYASARGCQTTAGKVYNNSGAITRSGFAASAEGWGTAAVSDYQHVIGKWNRLDEEQILTSLGHQYAALNKFAFIIGNGDDALNRSDAMRVDWSGSGWFANSLTAQGNVVFGSSATNNHTFNGKVCFKNPIRTHSNLKVDGNTNLGGTLIVAGLAKLNGDLEVSSNITAPNLNITATTLIEGSLNISATSTFSNDVSFTNSAKSVNVASKLAVTGDSTFEKVRSADLTTTKLNVTDTSVLGRTTVNGDIDITGKTSIIGNIDITGGVNASEGIVSATDVKVVNTNDNVSLIDEHKHLDYSKLVVAEKADQTVPNALAYTEAKLIGERSLNVDNLGALTVPTLEKESIYGAAQFSINLVKNLLNAYILDSDSDDPEARSAIDKLMEVAEWIKDDTAGAGKIISDVDSLFKNKLDADTYTQFKTAEYDVLSKLISDNKANWDAAYQDRHVHNNLTTLAELTSDNVSAWNNAVTQSHTHTNKTLIDEITSERMRLWDASSALLEGVSQEAIDGVIADGARITENTNRINNIIDVELYDMDVRLRSIGDEVTSVVTTVGSLEQPGSIMARLAALEAKLNALIYVSPDFDPEATATYPENPLTEYVIKYE